MRLGTDFAVRTAHHTTKPASPGRVSDRTNDLQAVLLVATVYVACAWWPFAARRLSPASGNHAVNHTGDAARPDRA